MNGAEGIIDTIEGTVGQAAEDLEWAREALELWKRLPTYPGVSGPPGRMLWKRCPEIMECLYRCLKLEFTMAQGALNWIRQTAHEHSAARTEILIAHYLLFGLIDCAARTLKTSLSRGMQIPTPEQLVNLGRRSLHLHWRVVHLVKGSTLLRTHHGAEIEMMEKFLSLQTASQWDVFVAHASADKQAVLKVLSRCKEKGKESLDRLHEKIAGFASNPNDLATLTAAFDAEQDYLDAYSLQSWIDSKGLIPGDDPDEKIRAVIEKARVLLVFYTHNYATGWWLRNMENPLMRAHFNERHKEGLRAIPVVLSAKAWTDYKSEWIAGQYTVTCPMNLKTLVDASSEDLETHVIDSLTNPMLLRAITGAP